MARCSRERKKGRRLGNRRPAQELCVVTGSESSPCRPTGCLWIHPSAGKIHIIAAHFPAPPMTLPSLRLKANADRRLRAGHLWVYSNEVDVAATPLSAFQP